MFYKQGKVTLICIKQSELWIKCLRSSSVCVQACLFCMLVISAAELCVRVPYPWYCIWLFLWIFSDKVQNRISCAVVVLAVLHMKWLVNDECDTNSGSEAVRVFGEWGIQDPGVRWYIQHTAQRMRDSSDYKRSKVPLYIVIPVGCSHLEKKIGENMKQSTVSRQSSLLLYFVVEIFHVRWGGVAECIIKSL